MPAVVRHLRQRLYFAAGLAALSYAVFSFYVTLLKVEQIELELHGERAREIETLTTYDNLSTKPGASTLELQSDAVVVQAAVGGVELARDPVDFSTDNGFQISAVSAAAPALPLDKQLVKHSSIVADVARRNVDEREKTRTHRHSNKSKAPVAKHLPLVERIIPPHGPEAGGIVLVIYGRNFMEEHTQVLIGSNSCAITHRLSDTALHCLLPQGSGMNLQVQVLPCGCATQQKNASLDFSSSLSKTTFSYSDAAAHQLNKATRKVVIRPSNLPVQLKMDTPSYPYEVSFFDASVEQRIEFALVPGLLDLIPPTDSNSRFETCAVVSGGAALAGSRSGPGIDAFSAIFRTDNSPSALRFSSDVGKRTTFQVLNREWGEALLKRSDSAGTPHVARWWLDVATVVLWHPASLRSFATLRTLYPDATVFFLSRDFESAARQTFQKLKANFEDVTLQQHVSANLHKEVMSSLLHACFMALQTCSKVSIYGVIPSCDSNMGRCRQCSYFEDVEPTYDQQTRAIFEEMVMLSLEQAKLLVVERPHKRNHFEFGGRANGSTSWHPLKCYVTYTTGNCTGKAKTEHGDKICDEGGLDLSSPELLKDVKMLFSDALLMSQSTVKLSLSEEQEIDTLNPVVEQDGVYRIDGRHGSLLAKDDAFLFDQHADHQPRLLRVNTFQYSMQDNGHYLSVNISARLGRCAVVGNSGALLNHNHGNDIDLHDVVYRFNQAPVDYFQTYVGSRTSHESLNSAWVKSSMDSKRHSILRPYWNWRKIDTTNVLFEMYDPAGLRSKSRDQYALKERWWRKSYTRLRIEMPERVFLPLSPQFMSWAYNLYLQLQRRFHENNFGEFRGEKPMSGFYAIIFLLQVCDELDIYGFTPFKEDDSHTMLSTAYHYFDWATPRKGSHSFDLTRYIYEMLDIAFPGRFKLHD